MRQDAKLGLALGMLVVGFAIAFCFPRPQDFPKWERHAFQELAEEQDFLPLRAYQPPADDISTIPEIVIDGGASLSYGELPESIQPLTQLELHEDGLQSAQTSLDELFQPQLEVHSPSVVEKQNIENEPDVPVRNEGQSDSSDSPITYRVQPGDTLTGIAYRTLGSSTRYFELYEYNTDRLGSPDDLRVGLVLRIPPSAKLSDVPPKIETIEEVPTFVDHSQSSPLRSNTKHVVQPGDTLEGISRKYYQDPRGVETIRQANPAVDPNRLRLGLELEIPVIR